MQRGCGWSIIRLHMMLHGDAVTGEVFTPRTPAGVTKGLSVRAFHHLKGAAAADRCCRPVRTDEGCPRSRGRIRVCQAASASATASEPGPNVTPRRGGADCTGRSPHTPWAPTLCDRYVRASSVRASRFVPSVSDGYHTPTRVSQSSIMAVSRFSNTFDMPRSYMASRAYLCEAPF